MKSKTMNIRRVIKKTAAVLTILAFMCPLTVYATEAGAEETAIPQDQVMPVVDPVDLFLSQSAFIGNSIGEGLTMYNNAKGKVPLGNATMLTRVSYSFMNDAGRAAKFMPVFNGKAMQAKDAVKLCGAQYVFICMGTNDLVGSTPVASAVERYKQYVAGIMTENPAVTIFIESCTPTRPGSNVNNEKITQFNAQMQVYCDMFPNMFYVDIATPLKDASGYLSAGLCSDGSCHLTGKAYEMWAQTIRVYITNFLLARAAQIQAMHEQERAVARKNYEAAIRKMEQKKQETFNIRLQAKKDAEAAEREHKHQELLNVPGEADLIQRLMASAKDSADNAGKKTEIAKAIPVSFIK